MARLVSLAVTVFVAFASNTVLAKPNRHKCTVKALGDGQNDVPDILAAFEKCNHGGTVVFPESENYWIAETLNPVLKDVHIDWKGNWTVRTILRLQR